MAARLHLILIFCLLLILLTSTNHNANANADAEIQRHSTLMNETLQWQQFHSHFDLQPETIEDENNDESHRRSLYWKSPAPRKYYISYGALSANRVPCPPRSGRSYYTHNCFRARGPVHPYTRGCSAVTRCRR
ncbi:hypothetical protein BUALT_Bualt01G0132000 [Buddleja alternifolia]|uniref:Protein RALF-like 34 n=1 Tax=Buddleja alternifolia TaxID=168488 RepID=A0AAV6YDS3_9LAMI|nr:hypothetical protein BUALT_Bualt01G0132000 [Buddleja alternifolia]